MSLPSPSTKVTLVSDTSSSRNVLVYSSTMETGLATQEPWLESCIPSASDDRASTSEHACASFVQLKPTCPSISPVDASSSDVLSINEQKEVLSKVLRPHSTPATLMWLEENYEIADGVCIPRSTLYMHYVDFCGRNGMQPVNAASFGKIIRQQFPQLTTRRLGTRGQSRYHYYGIAVRETSPYFDVSFSKKSTNVGDVKKEVIKQTSHYSQKSKLGALLPEFPSIKDLRLPPTVPEDKIATFVMMYRTHCQRVLDTIIRASFDEVQSFLTHFWQGMPTHIMSILGSNVVVNIVGVCDSILYRAIANVLLPSVLQPLPDSLNQVIRKFAQELESWVRIALDDLPDNLVSIKVDLARRFSQTLRRQTSLNHLCQASRMVLHNCDVTAQMLQDWRNIDLDSISRQTLYTLDHAYTTTTLELVTSLYREFETLVEEQAPIEAYLDWLEAMVDKAVVQPGRKQKLSIRRLARQFLLTWSSFGTRVIRDMTLHSAPSFGSFHLLHLMFDDYVLYLVETLYSDERMRELFANITTDTLPSFPDTEETFGDPDNNVNKIKWFSTSTTSVSSDHVIPNPSMILSSSNTPNGSEVVPQTSPPQGIPEATAMRENCIISEESVTSDSPSADSNNQMLPDYSTSEQYSGMYAYSSYDNRNGYRHPSHISRQEQRNYAYTTNQYVMASHNSDGGQLDVTRVTHTRSPETVNGIEYANTYLTYPSTRRGEYTECPGYMYEQGTASASILYPSGNCYYQPYDATGSHAYYSNRYKVKEEATGKEREDANSEPKASNTAPPTSYPVAGTNTYVRV